MNDAVTECPKCAARVYDDLTKCPHCGERLGGIEWLAGPWRRVMVPIIAALLLVTNYLWGLFG